MKKGEILTKCINIKIYLKPWKPIKHLPFWYKADEFSPLV